MIGMAKLSDVVTAAPINPNERSNTALARKDQVA
jgi:hypothetical protein